MAQLKGIINLGPFRNVHPVKLKQYKKINIYGLCSRIACINRKRIANRQRIFTISTKHLRIFVVEATRYVQVDLNCLRIVSYFLWWMPLKISESDSWYCWGVAGMHWQLRSDMASSDVQLKNNTIAVRWISTVPDYMMRYQT